MADDASIFLGASRKPDDSYQHAERLLLKYGNRHGLVTGATGTGKTVSLQIMAEGFSNAGVPVFCADIKGDLSGIAMKGTAQDFLLKRASEIRLDPYEFDDFPVIFWDLFGEQGHPIRATISEMGPLLLSRLMNLTEAQEGIMNIAFKLADEEGLLLLDLKDLQPFTLYGKNGKGGQGHNDDLSLTSNDGSASARAPVVYRVYRQNYSAAVVNLSRGTEARHFVKSVVGEQTMPGTLVNGTYSYAGVTFSNFPRGMFDYQVAVTGPSTATGQGSFSLNELKIPASQSSTGMDIFFDITNGKLDPTALATTSNGLVFDGDVTITNADVSNPAAWNAIKGPTSNPTYSLTLFGPQGAEIAGSIEGLPERIGSVAVIGAKQ